MYNPSGTNQIAGYSYANPENLYAGSPIDEVKKLNEDASAQYDAGVQAKNALDLLYNNLDVETRGKHIKDRAFQEYQGKIQDLISKGNYQDAKYLVNDLTQNFRNDKELQGALKSKANSNAYYQDLKDRLEAGQQNVSTSETEGEKSDKTTTKRSSGINKDTYLYGLSKTQALNQEPLKYNPETGLIENSFQGHNVVDDKSKQIYDELHKRTDGWKADSIDVNGETFKRVPGGYVTLGGEQVTKEEVQKALMTELANRGDFKDYLNQERDIDKYKLTGGTGNISLENLSSLGVSKEALDKLKEINPTQQDLNSAFDKIYTSNQFDKYTDPASDKASYKKVDYKEDKILLEDIAHKHRLAEKKAEKELEDHPMLPTNPSAIVPVKPKDLDALVKTKGDLLIEKNALLAEAQNATPERQAEINQRVAILDNKSKLLAKNQNAFESEMNRNGYITNDAYANTLDHTQEGETMKYDLAKAIMNLPANKMSSTLRASAAMVLDNKDSNLSTEDFLNEADKFIDSKRVVDDLKEVMKNKANVDVAAGVDNAASTGGSFGNLAGQLLEKSKAYIDKEKTQQYTTNFLGIDEDNNNNKKNENPHNAIARELRDQLKSLITNPQSEFLTESGRSLYEIASGQATDFKLIDDKGKEAKADLNRSKINIATKSVNGEVPVGITFYDDKGNALYYRDSKKQASMLFYPTGNSEVTKAIPRQIAQSYFKTNNPEKIKEGVKYMADMDYKSNIDKQVDLTKWTSQPKGYAQDFILDGQHLKLIKTGGVGSEDMGVAPVNSDIPITLYNYPQVIDGKQVTLPITNFKSLDQLSELLWLNNNADKIVK